MSTQEHTAVILCLGRPVAAKYLDNEHTKTHCGHIVSGLTSGCRVPGQWTHKSTLRSYCVWVDQWLPSTWTMNTQEHTAVILCLGRPVAAEYLDNGHTRTHCGHIVSG